MQAALVASAKQVDHLVDRVDQEHHNVAEDTRTCQRIVVLHNMAFGLIEQFAYYTSHHRGYHDVLVTRTLHTGLDAELPAYGRDTGRI